MGKKSVFYWFLRSLSRYSSNLRGREGQNNSPIFPNSAQKFPIQLSNHAEQADCNPSQCLRSPAPVSMRPAPCALLHAPCSMRPAPCPMPHARSLFSPSLPHPFSFPSEGIFPLFRTSNRGRRLGWFSFPGVARSLLSFEH